MKALLILVAALITICPACSQTIKILDAVASQREVLLRQKPGFFTLCYAVQNYNTTSAKLRIYKFDSVPRIHNTADLELYGDDYKLLSYGANVNYGVVAGYSRNLSRLALCFLDAESNPAGGPLLLTVPDKKPELLFMMSEVQDVCFVLISSAAKKNTTNFRMLAFTPPGRIKWETQLTTVNGEDVTAFTCDDKIIVRTSTKGLPVASSAFSQLNGSPAENGSSSKCLQVDESYSPGKQVALGSRKTIWVDRVTTTKGSYLIGEEYSSDATAGQVVGGAVLALTGVYAGSFTSIKFIDVVIQPMGADSTSRPQPRFVQMVPRVSTMPGSASPPVAAEYSVSLGQNRYVGSKAGKARFIAGSEIQEVDVETGETSLFGRFQFKGKLPKVVYVSTSGLLLKDIDEQTGVITFRAIPFQ